jgi:hypothetical protein
MNLDHFLKLLAGIDNATSNPSLGFEWMRENMPIEIEDFYMKARMLKPTLTAFVAYIHDLSNLARYLIENPQWGEKKCDNCYGNGFASNGTMNELGEYICDKCNGTGTIIHKALMDVIDIKSLVAKKESK